MEIIMKLKCSPNPGGGGGGGSPTQPTLKIVDQHHHQVQQHTNFNSINSGTPPQLPPSFSIPPTMNTSSASSECPATAATCAECNVVDYCCNLPACCMSSPPVTTPQQQHLPTPPPLLPLHATATYGGGCGPTSNLNQQLIMEDQQLPEFVSIDDEKVKEYLMKFGQQQLEQQRKQQQQQQQEQQQNASPLNQTMRRNDLSMINSNFLMDTHNVVQEQTEKNSKVTRVFSMPSTSDQMPSRPVVYEIIELDDEGEREKLKQIKKQAEQRLAAKKAPTSTIDINYAARHTKSLNISLIPKTPEVAAKKSKTIPSKDSPALSAPPRSKTNPANHNIIAEISLIDSSDEDEYAAEDDENPSDDDEEDDDLPLVNVSCELQCDDDDDDDEEDGDGLVETFVQNPSYNSLQLSSPRSIAPAKSFMKSRLEGTERNNEDLLVRWEEYEGQRERVFFECFLCGKKVQSSYNLRRHMMIHTGERPFACDMCDRRFREFSDLKKHRRRHSNEPNFVCMICREYPPLENDSTRCSNCCTQSKNAVLEAGMRINEEKMATDMATEPQIDMDIDHITTSQPAAIKAKILQITSPPPLTPRSPPLLIASRVQLDEEINTPPKTIPSTGGASSSPEDTQRLLDNIPAVHRPGYNQLGMITRKEFPCPLCNRAFGTRHNLKRHYMIHTGEKPFSCTKCRKPFREYSTLKKHMVTHQRDRWYKCIQCPMKYRDFLKYTEHKQSHAKTEGGDSDEPSSERSLSKSHKRYQSDDADIDYMDSNEDDSYTDDWLECCECEQRFNDIDAYNQHVKEHETT